MKYRNPKNVLDDYERRKLEEFDRLNRKKKLPNEYFEAIGFFMGDLRGAISIKILIEGEKRGKRFSSSPSQLYLSFLSFCLLWQVLKRKTSTDKQGDLGMFGMP